MITYAAALSYVRLERANLQDAGPVVELFKLGKISVLNGSASALAFDDMVPIEDEIITMIEFLENRSEGELSIIGHMDSREYLLSCFSKCEDQASRSISADLYNQKIKT